MIMRIIASTPGTDEVPACQRGVVEDPDRGVHAHRLDLPEHAGVKTRQPLRGACALFLGDNEGCIRQPDCRGLRVGAVRQELKRRRLCPRQLPSESGDDEGKGGLSFLNASFGALDVRNVRACHVAS